MPVAPSPAQPAARGRAVAAPPSAGRGPLAVAGLGRGSWLLAAVVALGLGGVGAPGAQARPRAADSCADTGATLGAVGVARFGVATRCLLQAARADRGAGPVASSPRLVVAARRQVRREVAQGYFAHVGPDGKDLAVRLREAGWIPRAGSWSAGEVLGRASGSVATPRALVAAWMASPEHLAILRDPSYDEVGVGVTAGTPGGEADGVTAAVELGRRVR